MLDIWRNRFFMHFHHLSFEISKSSFYPQPIYTTFIVWTVERTFLTFITDLLLSKTFCSELLVCHRLEASYIDRLPKQDKSNAPQATVDRLTQHASRTTKDVSEQSAPQEYCQNKIYQMHHKLLLSQICILWTFEEQHKTVLWKTETFLLQICLDSHLCVLAYKCPQHGVI